MDVSAAVRVTDESMYVGKVVEHLGSAYFMAFRDRGRTQRSSVGSPIPSR